MNCLVDVTHSIANDYLHFSQCQYGFLRIPYSVSLSQVQLNFVNILKVAWNRFVKRKYWIENRHLRPWFVYSVLFWTTFPVLYSIQIYVEKLQFMGYFCLSKLFRSIHWSYLEEIKKEKAKSYLIYWCFYDTMQPAIKCRETILEYIRNRQDKTTLWGVYLKKNSLLVVLLMRQSPFVNDFVFGYLLRQLLYDNLIGLSHNCGSSRNTFRKRLAYRTEGQWHRNILIRYYLLTCFM